jgi:hypothetical protein
MCKEILQDGEGQILLHASLFNNNLMNHSIFRQIHLA